MAGLMNWTKLLGLVCLVVLPSTQAQVDPSNEYLWGIYFGGIKTLEMDAESVGAGKQFGIEGLYILNKYMAVGVGGSAVGIGEILISKKAPEISLEMFTGKGIFRLKTETKSDNVYFFLDLVPAITADVISNDPEDSGYKFKNYWGPVAEISLGTAMGAGMIKLTSTNNYLDKEWISWLALSLGFSI